MGGTQQPQAVEVVTFDHQVAVLCGPGWRMAPFGHRTRQHDVGVERGIPFNGAAFPVQAHFRARQVFYQQAP